jgi:hypothetical protein
VPATRKVGKKSRARVAHKPMVSLPANLHTEDTREVRRSPAERKAVRSEAKREYREERAPRTVTVEEYAEPNPVQVLRSPRFVDEDDEVVVAPRQDGFFGLFR